MMFKLQIDCRSLGDGDNSEWDRWCNGHTNDPRIVSLDGVASDGSTDRWLVDADDVEAAKQIVADYAASVGVDTPDVEVERA